MSTETGNNLQFKKSSLANLFLDTHSGKFCHVFYFKVPAEPKLLSILNYSRPVVFYKNVEDRERSQGKKPAVVEKWFRGKSKFCLLVIALRTLETVTVKTAESYLMRFVR